jgi:hypothetical protein
MTSVSPDSPYYAGDTLAQPDVASSSHRRSRQTNRPGRSKPEDLNDLKGENPSPSESEAEQEHNTRVPGDRHVDSFDDADKGPKGATVITDVLYSINCLDKQNKRNEVFTIPENPFEELILQDFENPRSLMILGIFIIADGIGSPLYWTQYAPNPFADPFAGEKERLPYGEKLEIAARRGRAGPYTPSPPRSPPRRRAKTYSDITSEVSDENDEDSLRDALFDGPTRESTFKPDGRASLSLQEVLNRGIFRASSVRWTEIEIYSRNLAKLFRSLIQRYPGQSLKGEPIIVKAPFEMLAHYYNDLTALQNGTSHVLSNVKFEVTDNAKKLEMLQNNDLLDEATSYDLSVLLRAFRLHYMKNFALEEARYNVGVASFGLLWFLYRPGVEVYARIGGKIAGFIFERWEKRAGRERVGYDGGGIPERDKIGYCVAYCWSLTYNGRHIVKTWHEVIINKFRGERQITSLPVFPCHYLDKEDGGKTRIRLQNLGEKCYSIIRQSPAHREYCGMAWDLEQEDYSRDQTRWHKWKPSVVITILHVIGSEDCANAHRNMTAR